MKKFALALALVTCVGAWPRATSAAIIDEFVDDCSVSLWIKRPYSDSIQIDAGDILLARGWQGGNICALLDTFPGGVCQTSQGQTTAWTGWIPYSQVKNSNGYFRWICGQTRERSRCPTNTQKVRFRLLGGDDEFQTQCSNLP
jgi:hypothetical protein